jgi:spermidine dehydrogenase
MGTDSSMSASDRALGMDRPIARRDFLGGVALAGAAAGLGLGTAEAAPQDMPGYYPPVLQGLRGSHPGSFEAAHSLRDGTFWDHAEKPEAEDAPYDLIVVGGGISGLAAARFYRDARPSARVLVLDNHDDFGGHAKRNEFHVGGRLQLMNGGTLEIDSPRPYSKISEALINRLGIDPERLEKSCSDLTFYKRQGLGRGIFLNREVFGADFLATGVGTSPWKDVLQGAPLSARCKEDIARIYEAKIDYMPGLTSDEKKARLARMSYLDYLTKVVKADPGVCLVFQAMSQDEWGVGADAVNALDVWTFDFPGFQGLNLADGAAPGMGQTAAGYAVGGSAKFHFPDGNATIARLLVRDLVPGALPGHTVQDVVLARADYAALDRPGAGVRIRLSSIVVGARNIGGPAASTGVEVAYTRGGKVFRVPAKNCVLACYNMMIPYLCPEMSDKQKDALHYLVKIPLVYTSVAIRSGRPFEKLGISEVYAPASYHCSLRLNPKTVIGGYDSVGSPDAPTLVFMVRNPCAPGLDERSQHRIGRADMLATSFETFERNIRDQLGRILGPGGFDPAHDITAITVNRWPHGYAYEYNYLFDPQWAPGQAPHEIGRARFGRITIANSDSGAAAYTDSAIDQAHRAVAELLAI